MRRPQVRMGTYRISLELFLSAPRGGYRWKWPVCRPRWACARPMFEVSATGLVLREGLSSMRLAVRGVQFAKRRVLWPLQRLREEITNAADSAVKPTARLPAVPASDGPSGSTDTARRGSGFGDSSR